MIKKVLLVFLAILLFMGFFAVALLIPVLLLGGDEVVLLGVIFGSIILFVGLFIPYLNIIEKKIWKFEPAKNITPLSLEELRKKIFYLNSLDIPIMIAEKKRKIIISWKYVDAKWWQIMSKQGLKKTYELIIKLDDAQKTATLIDILKFVEWGVGPEFVKFRASFFRGINLRYEVGKQWSFNEMFQPGKIYDYKFDSQEIKNPILNEILNSGWTVKFGMW